MMFNRFTGYNIAQPLSQLLHSINQYCIMKKRDLFAMNEMDLKFNKIDRGFSCQFLNFGLKSKKQTV